MNWLIDIILLAVIGLTALRHFKVGLSYTLYNLGKFILAILAALLLGKLLGSLLFGAIGEGLGERLGSVGFAETLCSVIAYVLVFVITLLVLTLVIKGLRRIEIPVLHEIDKVLGLVLGLALGVFSACMIATVVYTILELYASFTESDSVMQIYGNSYVFRFIYELKIFEFIRSLI